MILKGVIPMTGNRYLRSHWTQQRKETRHWEKTIISRWGCGPWRRRDAATPPGIPCKVRIMVCRKKLQDEENFKLSLKPVYDGLVRSGWIYDDAPNWVVREDVEVKGQGKCKATLIQVWGQPMKGGIQK